MDEATEPATLDRQEIASGEITIGIEPNGGCEFQCIGKRGRPPPPGVARADGEATGTNSPLMFM